MDMKKHMETGLLSIFLSLSSVSDVSAQNETAPNSAKPEFQFTVGKGAMKRYIPVDCDLLAKDGSLTSSFVKQMGVWGHLDSVEDRMGPNASESSKIFAFKQHLRPHGISGKKIDKVASYCHANYPSQD